MIVLLFMILPSVSGIFRNGSEIHGTPKSLLAKAASSAMSRSFNKSAFDLDVAIESDSHRNLFDFIDILDEILKEPWNSRIKINVFIHHADGVRHSHQSSAGDYNLWFIDSSQAFRKLLTLVHAYKGDSQLYFLIILKFIPDQEIFDVMRGIFSDMLTMMLTNVIILAESTVERTALIYTFIPFQHSVCRSIQPELVGTFANDILSSETLFPSKTDNFRGCPMQIITRNSIFFAKIRRIDGFLEIWALEHEIMNVLAHKMNFKSNFSLFHAAEQTEVLEDGTPMGPFKKVQNGEVDMMVGFFKHGPTQDLIFTPSLTYFNTHVVIALPRPPFGFQKLGWLVNAFELSAWFCILILLVLTVMCTTFVSWNSYLVKILELRRNGWSVFEIFKIAIGGAVEHLPSKNCLRLCFMVWCWGTMLLRATYEGMLFNSYRRLYATQTPLTVKQLLTQNYTIHSQPVYMPAISELSGIGDVTFTDLTLFSVLTNLSGKNAVIASYVYIYTVHNNGRNNIKNLVMEPVNGDQVCMFFQQHSTLVLRVNMIIQWMEESGILQPWRAHYEHLKNINFKTGQPFIPGPGPILLSRFKYLLYLFVVPYSIAIIVFILELGWSKILRCLMCLKSRHFC